MAGMDSEQTIDLNQIQGKFKVTLFFPVNYSVVKDRSLDTQHYLKNTWPTIDIMITVFPQMLQSLNIFENS